MTITASDRNAIYLNAPKASSKDTRLGLGTAAFLDLALPIIKMKLVTGGAAGNFTVTGIETTDSLVGVLRLVAAGTTMTNITDLSSEFTISALNTVNNTSGTATTGDKLLVFWAAGS